MVVAHLTHHGDCGPRARWRWRAPSNQGRVQKTGQLKRAHRSVDPQHPSPIKAGRLINELKMLAENIGSLPRVEHSPDPTDDFLLALSEAGKADYLVTGDKGGLLALDCHKATRITSASDFAAWFV